MEKRSRGGCLTAFIIVMLVFSVLGIVSMFSLQAMVNMDIPAELKTVLEASTEPVMFYSSIILSLVNIAGLILMLTWRKIGVYLYVGASVISMLINFFTAGDTTAIIISFASTAILLLIFYFLIRNVFKHMK